MSSRLRRGSGPLRDEFLTGDRPTGRLRPISSASIHETVVPDKQPSFDPTRKLSPAEFNTAMAHFYRGEIQRSNTWRNRLDTTTNWAVLSAGAMLSFAFSSPNTPHFVIPVDSILVAVFLIMEARRYRYYEIWSSRVRVMETGYLARMLAPESVPADKEWASHLAADLLTPHFTISVWEAIGRRLRRNYIWLFALLALSWNLKVYLYPDPARTLMSFFRAPRLAWYQVGWCSWWDLFLTRRYWFSPSARFGCARRPVKFCRATNSLCTRCEWFPVGDAPLLPEPELRFAGQTRAPPAQGRDLWRISKDRSYPVTGSANSQF